MTRYAGPPCKGSLDESKHYWSWEPLYGGSLAPYQGSPTLPGMYRVTCGYGCGWEKEVTITGEEVWTA